MFLAFFTPRAPEPELPSNKKVPDPETEPGDLRKLPPAPGQLGKIGKTCSELHLSEVVGRSVGDFLDGPERQTYSGKRIGFCSSGSETLENVQFGESWAPR